MMLLLVPIICALKVESSAPATKSLQDIPSENEANKIVNIINKERGKFFMEPIVYNQTVSEALYNFNENLDLSNYNNTGRISLIDWYYTNSEYSYKYKLFNGTRRWNSDFIMERPELASLKSDNWTWMMRDRTFRSVSYILNFRINQKNVLIGIIATQQSFMII